MGSKKGRLESEVGGKKDGREKHRDGKQMKRKNRKSNLPVTGRAENGFSDSA